jgi:hypothetical protein
MTTVNKRFFEGQPGRATVNKRLFLKPQPRQKHRQQTAAANERTPNPRFAVDRIAFCRRGQALPGQDIPTLLPGPRPPRLVKITTAAENCNGGGHTPHSRPGATVREHEEKTGENRSIREILSILRMFHLSDKSCWPATSTPRAMPAASRCERYSGHVRRWEPRPANMPRWDGWSRCRPADGGTKGAGKNNVVNFSFWELWCSSIPHESLRVLC